MTLHRLRQSARAGLLSLLACIVPLQCAAALVRSTAGPSHVHAAPTAKPAPVLHDFRRHGPAALLASEARHGHAHGEALRHHHTTADLAAGIAVDDLDRRDAAEERSGSASSLLMPIPSEASPLRDVAAVHARFEAALWVASLRVDALAERPPRSAAR